MLRSLSLEQVEERAGKSHDIVLGALCSARLEPPDEVYVQHPQVDQRVPQATHRRDQLSPQLRASKGRNKFGPGLYWPELVTRLRSLTQLGKECARFQPVAQRQR